MYVWQISFDVQLQNQSVIKCVCLANFIWRSTSIQSVIVTFSKTKMNGNSHLHFLLQCHLNVTCLVVLVILISKVSIDVVFFFTNHFICQILNRACPLTCILFLGASICVSNIKNFVKNTHWPALSSSIIVTELHNVPQPRLPGRR